MQGQVCAKGGWNEGDELLILVYNERSDSQPMPLLKQANVTTEMVRMQSTVGTVYEEER